MDVNKLVELDRTLNRVMDMLKYAEAKNTVLLTFEVGVIYAVLSEFSYLISENPWYLLWGTSFFSSVIILLLSFVPNLLKTKNGTSSTNLQFYGDIAKLTANDYINEYDRKFEEANDFYEDIFCQIHYNSKITLKKFKTFKLAISVLFVFPILFLLISIIYQKIAKSLERV